MKPYLLPITALLVAASSSACGTRDDVWDAPPAITAALGLSGSVALVDAQGERVMLLPVEADLRVDPVSVPLGRNFAAADTTAEKDKLLILTRGDVPRRRNPPTSARASRS